jgi:phage terminase small subunit
MEKKLTPRQKRFCECYLSNGFNATQACLDAGYKEKNARSQGAENLTKPNIASYIDARKLKDAKNLGITRDTLLKDIKDIMSNAQTDGQHSVCMKGVELMTKMLGLNEPEKVEVSGGIVVESEPAF